MLTQVLSHKISGNVATRLDGFERLLWDYESQSRRAVTDATKIGVAIRGSQEPQIRDHLIRNAAEEILEATRAQHYANAQPMPTQRGACQTFRSSEP